MLLAPFGPTRTAKAAKASKPVDGPKSAAAWQALIATARTNVSDGELG